MQLCSKKQKQGLSILQLSPFLAKRIHSHYEIQLLLIKENKTTKQTKNLTVIQDVPAQFFQLTKGHLPAFA